MFSDGSKIQKSSLPDSVVFGSHFRFSQILVTSICDSFSPVLVDENSNRF